MILLSGLLDVFFRAGVFVGLALSVGGIVFRYVVVRPLEGRHADATRDAVPRRAASLILVGAILVMACQIFTLVIAPWALADETGRWPLAEFLSTGFARAGLLHAALAGCLSAAALFLYSRPRSGAAWAIAFVLALLTMASGGPLTHGASRLQHAGLLMTVTVLHQLPAVAWAGGTAHLVGQWRLLRRDPAGQALWARMTARFSPLAATCVAALLLASVYLTWQYVRTADALIGTAYGTMLTTKVVLTAAALALGGMNFLAIRRWKITGNPCGLIARVPVLVETEAALAIGILMIAAAFTGQPPAADVADRATPAEVAHVFAPKLPQVTMPPFRQMVATSTGALDLYSLPADLEKLQSDFNHNMCGLFVLLAGLGALLYQAARANWARHWPLVFVALGLFILAIAEPTVWPLGPESFFATLISPEVLVHRVAALLVIVLGIFEWRVRAGALAHTRWRYAFPLLCFVGGALLLTHSHSVFATKWAFLIEVSHNALGILALLAGAARWLELRLPGREARWAGALWPVCLTLVGMVLLFYRET